MLCDRLFLFSHTLIVTLCDPEPNRKPNPIRHFIAFHRLKTLAFKYTMFLPLPLGGRPVRFNNFVHTKNLLEISSYDAKLMPSLADGKAKIAFTARNSFD